MFFFFDFDMNDRSEETFLVVSFFYMFEVTCIKSKDTNFIYYYSALYMGTNLQILSALPRNIDFLFSNHVKIQERKKEIVGRHSWNICTNEENYFTSSLTLWKAVWNRVKTSVRIGHIDVLYEMDPAGFNISCKFQTVNAVVFLWTMYPHCLNFKTSADDITIMEKTHSWWWLCLVRISSTNLALPFACMHKYDIKIVQIC